MPEQGQVVAKAAAKKHRAVATGNNLLPKPQNAQLRGTERDLVAAFAWPYSRLVRETLASVDWGDELAAQLADVQVEMRGLAKTIDALVMIAANHSCDRDLTEIEQNAWRRAGNALVEARKCAQAGEL